MPIPPGVIDRRSTAIQAHGPSRNWKVFTRPWSAVTGVCLHQTACLLGERGERWDSVGAHVGITKSGAIMWLHDWNKVVAHGNAWNAQCVGIEIDGLFAGVEGDPKTLWDDPSTKVRELEMHPTPEQVEATKTVIRWIDADVQIETGKKLHALVAHRQSSASRRDDPGSAVWKQIALPMIAELGLTDGGPGFKLGDGFPIPVEWDPSRTSYRY